MIFKVLILFTITSILFTANSWAILDPSEVGRYGDSSLADKLIGISQGVPMDLRSDTRFPATPFESRKLQENKSVVWSPMPKSLGAQGKTPEESRSLPGDQIDAQSSVPNVEENRVAGTWSFELNDTESRQIVLTLFQIEDAIFGSGSIKDGENTFMAAASGSINGGNLGLDIISIGTVSLYRLATNLSDDAVSGTYKAYSASSQISTGTVQGIRNLPMS